MVPLDPAWARPQPFTPFRSHAPSCSVPPTPRSTTGATRRRLRATPRNGETVFAHGAPTHVVNTNPFPLPRQPVTAGPAPKKRIGRRLRPPPTTRHTPATNPHHRDRLRPPGSPPRPHTHRRPTTPRWPPPNRHPGPAPGYHHHVRHPHHPRYELPAPHNTAADPPDTCHCRAFAHQRIRVWYGHGPEAESVTRPWPGQEPTSCRTFLRVHPIARAAAAQWSPDPEQPETAEILFTGRPPTPLAPEPRRRPATQLTRGGPSARRPGRDLRPPRAGGGPLATTMSGPCSVVGRW